MHGNYQESNIGTHTNLSFRYCEYDMHVNVIILTDATLTFYLEIFNRDVSLCSDHTLLRYN